jgi:hypothetical protein
MGVPNEAHLVDTPSNCTLLLEEVSPLDATILALIRSNRTGHAGRLAQLKLIHLVGCY